MAQPLWEVADILLRDGDAYRAQHALPAHQLRMMDALQRCRTASLGGHIERCGHCDYQRISYNSCRNRHCPKCQNLARAQWIEKRKAELLPIAYFHVVFTIPEQLNPLALQKAFAEDRLSFHGNLAPLAQPPAFDALLTPLRRREWVVYAKPPFGGPQQVIEYLGRYTHRVAISNHRIKNVENGQVTFQYK